MAKKLNLSVVKEFMFNHGEKVALGACAFIAVVLGGVKLLDAAGAGNAEGTSQSWPEALTQTKTSLSQQVARAEAKPFDKNSIDPKRYIWDPVESKFVSSPYAQVGEVDDRKRRNPAPSRILDDPKYIRMDYIRSLIFVHDYEDKERTVKGVVPAGGGAGGGANPMPSKGPKKMAGAGAAGIEQAASIPDRMKKGRGQSFVIVHAVFPMKEQVEEFRKALKAATQKELFDQPRVDLPKIKGINVVRFELSRPGGDVLNTTEIVMYDPSAEKLKMQPALEKLLREAMYDESLLPTFEPYLYDGLAMPLPQLAYGRYPKFQFPGWELAWSEDGAEPEKKVAGGGAVMKPPMPQGGGGGVIPPGRKTPPPNPANPPQPGVAAAGASTELEEKRITDKELREVDITLSNRLFGDPDNMGKLKLETDFNVFQVLGQIAPPVDETAQPAQQPNMPVRPGLPGMPGAGNAAGKYFDAWDIDPPNGGSKGGNVMPGPGPMPMPNPKKGSKTNPNAKDQNQPVWAAWERDAVVRFIDADVQPGKTYAYAVQVRIANPNYKKPAEKVAFEMLARDPELPVDASTWVSTPSITIPQNYFLYAMDQHQYDQTINPPAKVNKSVEDAYKLPKEATTFQIHQWLGSDKYDQRIAEREPYAIGDWGIIERQVVRKGARIGAEEWIVVPVWKKMKEAFELPRMPQGKKQPDAIGAHLRFKDDDKAPVLIDFTGGKKMKPNNTAVEEETAVDALILTPDGKLRVHNSRDDAYAKEMVIQIQDQQQLMTRQERVLETRKRIDEVRQATAPPPAIPKK